MSLCSLRACRIQKIPLSKITRYFGVQRGILDNFWSYVSSFLDLDPKYGTKQAFFSFFALDIVQLAGLCYCMKLV